jgi:hypothetical protein
MPLDEATEITLQAFLAGLEGADDDDTIRPGLVLKVLGDAMGQDGERAAGEVEGVTVAEMRRRMRNAMARLAHGDGPEASA